MSQETIPDYACCSTSVEIACPLDKAKTLANFATFRNWSGFPIFASDDGRTRRNEEGTIVEVLEETHDFPGTFGYSYGFTQHSLPVSKEVLANMKGRFVLRAEGKKKTRLTWSWTFDVSPLIHVAHELLRKGAAPLEETSNTNGNDEGATRRELEGPPAK